MDLEEIGRLVLGCGIKVHSLLGPGLLEGVYQKCLSYELQQQGLQVECELSLPIEYGTITIANAYRVDMLIERQIIIENKAVEKILPIHEAQLLTYLRLKRCKLGYLLNWHVPVLKEGIRRLVNNL